MQILGYGSNDLFKQCEFYALNLFFYPCLILLITIPLVRMWLLYYDTQISKLKLQKAWLSVIDTNAESGNWFRKHERTFGNAVYLTKFCVTYAILLTIINALLRRILLETGISIMRMVDTMNGIISYVLIGIIWYKLRKCQYDNLGIRHEMIAYFTTGFIWFIAHATVVTLNTTGIINETIFEILWRYVFAIIVSALILVITVYPQKLSRLGDLSEYSSIWLVCAVFKCKCCWCLTIAINETELPRLKSTSKTTGPETSTRETTKSSAMDVDISVSGHVAIKSMSARSVSSGGTSGSLSPSYRDRSLTRSISNCGRSWTNIVCTLYGYESFMKHLETEFAIENLLFISEV